MKSKDSPFFPNNFDQYAPWVTKHGLWWPYGICQCGCDQSAPLARQSETRWGHIKGHPKRFIRGHAAYLKVEPTLADAFWRCATDIGPDLCWEWQGSVGKSGYGTFSWNGTRYDAHRASWEIHFGPIENGLWVCHTCDNKVCANPIHLFLGSVQDNVDDAILKGLLARGEQNHNARLTERDVRAIRAHCDRDHGEPGFTYKALGQKYGVHGNTIRRIHHRQSWKHVR